ncbi:hypothetical protein DZF91_37265 [Actinomadura logoneensis]|uniref:Uncharacterized protein n=1 Tax=Actinomadura logoneensis TaxID=2293572 RepID=A0A372J9F3_9ACTN|nr:hypothetical protein [Actinomadura logoneensis]RFU36617.1 hypothetical protein DZF91_37265 [Actinomadura logoneensis]
MTETFRLTVPDRTTWTFVVAAEQCPDDLPAAIFEHVSAPFAPQAMQRFGGPELAVSPYSASSSPWDLTDTISPDDADEHDGDLAYLRSADWHIGVTAVLSARDRPFGARVARAVAHAVREVTDGILADHDLGIVLPTTRPDDGGRFVLADDWITTPTAGRPAVPCPVSDGSVGFCSCLQLSTRGMQRLGLPELRISDVSCAHDLSATNVLRSLSRRLLPLGISHGTRVLPAEALVAAGDFAEYWGTDEPMWNDGPIPVRLIPISNHLLEVRAPEGYPGSVNEWLWDELPPILHELLGCDPDPTPGFHPS